jgi:F-type H+-transporting ATPase subunit b
MHPLLKPELGLWVWTLVAFLIVLFILKKYAWTPIIASLNERERSIADSIETAERVKAEMAQLQSENETLLAKAREERSEMMREAKATKDKIVHEAKEQAKVEANKIMEDLQVSINNRKIAAINDLKSQMGVLVVEMAEKVLQRELSNKDAQEKYIREMAESSILN